MGKTASGAVWLNADQVSPYEYWQYWRNTDDRDVVRFLKLFTVLPLVEIDRLAALKGSDINEAKKILATEATALVHGRSAADEAAATARTTFEQGGIGENLPTFAIEAGDLGRTLRVIDAALLAKLVSSRGEARRLIRGGGLRVNDKVVQDETQLLTANDLNPDKVIKLSLGRKNHALLKPV
jgi:tyrosyl-tRNA synthetase